MIPFIASSLKMWSIHDNQFLHLASIYEWANGANKPSRTLHSKFCQGTSEPDFKGVIDGWVKID